MCAALDGPKERIVSDSGQLLREHRTVDPIVAVLLDEYEVDETALRAEVERLLDELSDLGLIHIEPD